LTCHDLPPYGSYKNTLTQAAQAAFAIVAKGFSPMAEVGERISF
jgi:hypothetical protein